MVLALLIALFLANTFYQICRSEYALYRAERLLELSAVDDKLNRRGQVQQMIDFIKRNSDTSVNAAYRYRVLAKLYRILAEGTVWRSQKQSFYQDALYHNFNAINLRPHNAQNWMQNLDLQYVSSQPWPELAWSLERVLALGKWNAKAMQFGSFYCVLYWSQLSVDLNGLCKRTIVTLQADRHERDRLRNSLRTIAGHEKILQEVM